MAISGNKIRPASLEKTRATVFVVLAIAFALLAIARPRWGEDSSQAFSQTREVMIAIDLSRSMLTEDVALPFVSIAPQQLTENLLDSLQGESVGLVVFAGTAFVECRSARTIESSASSCRASTPTTRRAAARITRRCSTPHWTASAKHADRDRYLIVLSDGESSTEGWEQRLGRMAEREIHVVSIGLGTANGRVRS